MLGFAGLAPADVGHGGKSVPGCLNSSGKSCSVALLLESSVRELKMEAQLQLKRRFLTLLFKGRQLDASSSLSEAGVGDGDSIDAVVQPVKLAFTANSLAIYVPGGIALTWGDSETGGDSSTVREQLVRVQQIQATEGAFAAVLDNGSIVTWGANRCGGNSSQVREQLTRVRQAHMHFHGAVAHPGGRLP